MRPTMARTITSGAAPCAGKGASFTGSTLRVSRVAGGVARVRMILAPSGCSSASRAWPIPPRASLPYGCEINATATRYYSGIPASSATRTIVAVLDFDRDFIGLWVDPDANDYYTDATGANSCDAGGVYTSNNWSSAVRLASNGTCEWDHLMVATSWNDFQFVDPDTDNDGCPTLGRSLTDSWWEPTTRCSMPIRTAFPISTNTFTRPSRRTPTPTTMDFPMGRRSLLARTRAIRSCIPARFIRRGLVGGERFDYADGPILGKSGGLYWDADNSSENDAFVGHAGNPSDWDATSGSPQVTSGVLVTPRRAGRGVNIMARLKERRLLQTGAPGS